MFVECNVESKLCQSIQQSCPNSCSGHGKCVFVSKYDSNVTLLECGLLDLDCVSVCECDEDYLGSSSCSLPREEFVKQQNVRGVIVENVGELMKLENVDGSNVKSWIKTLSSSFGSDSSSLSVESKKKIIDILKHSRDVGLSYEELSESGMNKLVDMCVSGLSLSLSLYPSEVNVNDEDNSLLLMSLLKEYSGFVTSDMSNDQYPVSSITSNLRSSSFFLTTSSSSSSSSIIIPQTQLESLISTTNNKNNN